MSRVRFHRKSLLTAVVVVVAVALPAGSALAARAASYQAAAHQAAAGSSPRLTADTPAPCNASQRPGFARCLAVIRTVASHRIVADTAGPPAGVLGPAQLRSAYKLPAAGGGQTVALVDAYGDSAAAANLAVFRTHYGLPPCTTANGCFRQVNEEGKQGGYPVNDAGWALEISLDLDTVSAVCPRCNILLVEASSNATIDLARAASEAVRLGARFVSNSYTSAELSADLTLNRYYNHPGVAVTAATGDDGYGVGYPATSQYVTAVGGTTLTRDTAVPRGWQETVWGSASNANGGTGSGCSAFEPKPADQAGITTDCARRAVADLSADANPASGLAVYDTVSNGGWLQVGGTSLASPLIASAYALAGPSAAGSHPQSYPYRDPYGSGSLFDITQGVNGDCRTVLCRAGKGWDGPTGLGTPDGVKALASGTAGEITGQVTSKATGKPVPYATLTASPGGYVTRTDADGGYELTLTAGRYDLTAAGYGYTTAARAGLPVTAGHTATAGFALATMAGGALSGTVTDGSGHGWPLAAKITIAGYPGGTVWSSPVTGRYGVRLPRGSYTVTVTPSYPGYGSHQFRVRAGTGTTQNFSIPIGTSCTAPGYAEDGLTQNFAGWTGGTGNDGWTVSDGGTGPGWRFDNPGERPPPPRVFARANPDWPREFLAFGTGQFAVADPGFYAPRTLDTTLTSPPVSLAGQRSPEIAFDSAYYPDGGQQDATVQLSTDGGGSWHTVWQQTSSNALGPVTVPIPQAAGDHRVRVRFGLTGHGDGYWALGDVLAGTASCVPQRGSLLTGAVTSRASGQPVNGAQIASSASTGPAAWPAGLSMITDDPGLPGGYYWLFVPSGAQRVTAAAAGFAAATAQLTAPDGKVIDHDWALAQAKEDVP